MAADASIYSLIAKPERLPGPMEQMGQVMQLKHLMDQGALSGLQRQQLEKGVADDAATADAYRTAGGDVQKVRDLLYGKGLYKPAQAVEKTIQDRQKSEADLAAKRMETLSKGFGMLKDRLPTVRDDASYRQYVDSAVALLGPDEVKKLNLPPAFDPQWVQRQVVDAKELFTPKPQEMDVGGRKVVVDMNPWTNPSIVGSEFAKSLTPGEVQTGRHQQATLAETQRANAERERVAAATASGSRVSDIRKEFNALPQVKAYNEVQPVIQSAREALKQNTGAADLNIIYAVAKIFDPTSVVRESETAMTVQAGSPAERFLGQFNYVAGGGRLTKQAREDLMAQIESRARGFETGYKSVRKTYEGIADKNGLPKDQIFVEPFATAGQPPAAKPDTPAPGLTPASLSDDELKKRLGL